MFSATKFVVAGAIVALVGGFSLIEGLTQQPSDEQISAIGAPASVAAEPLRSDALTSSPEPAVEADSTSTTSDLLPGVDLEFEEVEPGVYRVLGDGFRNLQDRVHDVTVSAEGDVWLELGRSRNWSVVKLGQPGASPPLGRRHPWRLGLTPDGLPVVASAGGIRVLDGETWVKAKATGYDQCLRRGPFGAVGADGSCWMQGDDDSVLVRIEPDDTRTEVTSAEVGLAPDQGFGPGVVAPDGTLWFPVTNPDDNGSNFHGLAAYDGSTWSVIPFGSDAAVVSFWPVGVDADGVVWVPNLSEDVKNGGYEIWSWDGSSWASHRIDAAAKVPPLPVQVWPNGTIWFGPVATRWDGSTLSVVEAAVPVGFYPPLATAPDGLAWTVLDQQLYIITLEAGAVSESA